MRYFTADSIFSPGEGFLHNAVLCVEADGTIHELIRDADAATRERAERFAGVLCPGFVNTHCHLELSHMLGKVKQHTGFVGFAMELIPQRNYISREEIEVVCANADAAMFANGINGVGDISNIEVSFAAKKNSQIKYHTFIELLGLHPEIAQ